MTKYRLPKKTLIEMYRIRQMGDISIAEKFHEEVLRCSEFYQAVKEPTLKRFLKKMGYEH